MRQQRNMFQMKEQDKIPGEGLNEVEISDLPNKEIKVMTIKMIKELERRTEEQNREVRRTRDAEYKNEIKITLSSVAQSCPTLCNPMNHSTPGLPVHHKLPEFTQTHAHQVGDAIQPSHPLSSPSPPAPNPSQHQGLFQ